MLNWLVYEEHSNRPECLKSELKAGFQTEADALQYKYMMENFSKDYVVGYTIRYVDKINK